MHDIMEGLLTSKLRIQSVVLLAGCHGDKSVHYVWLQQRIVICMDMAAERELFRVITLYAHNLSWEHIMILVSFCLNQILARANNHQNQKSEVLILNF